MYLFSENEFINKLLWIINNSLVSELVDQCTYFVLSLLHYQPMEMIPRFNDSNILSYMSERFENWCKNEEQLSVFIFIYLFNNNSMKQWKITCVH